MNDDGTEARRLTHNTSDDFGAAWSPDGSTIVFGAGQFAPDGRGGLVLVGQQIFLIGPEGGRQIQLTDTSMRGQFPSWSTDGKQIAFNGTRGGDSDPSEIFLIHPDGSRLQQLTDNKWADARPDWSPDNRNIAFQSDRDGSVEIYVMNANGSQPVQLTFNTAPVANQAPDWSPDGKRMVFQSNRDGNFEIYVMNADGNGQTRLTNYAGRDVDPEWSPDGGRIAFDRDIPAMEQQIRQLFVMNADGTQQTPLTGLPSKNGHAAWSRAP